MGTNMIPRKTKSVIKTHLYRAASSLLRRNTERWFRKRVPTIQTLMDGEPSPNLVLSTYLSFKIPHAKIISERLHGNARPRKLKPPESMIPMKLLLLKHPHRVRLTKIMPTLQNAVRVLVVRLSKLKPPPSMDMHGLLPCGAGVAVLVEEVQLVEALVLLRRHRWPQHPPLEFLLGRRLQRMAHLKHAMERRSLCQSNQLPMEVQRPRLPRNH